MAWASVVSGCTGEIGGKPVPPGQAIGGAGAAAAGSTGAGGAGAGAGVSPVDSCLPGSLNVGASPLQRLTRDQYANSIRALLGLASVPTSDITPDEKLGPFASNVSAAVTDLVVEQYARSGENLAKAALAQAKWDTLVPCDHASLGDAGCAAQFVQKFGMRVYRRPLSAPEQERYAAEYQAFAGSGYDNGLRVVVETMLQSPSFLYRPEIGAGAAQTDGPSLLLPFELASRLAFFLWSSSPDDELLAAASASKLGSEDELRAQATRLLADPRSRDTIASFHRQWLGVDASGSVYKDPAVYPSFSDATSAAMAEETVDFADYVLRRGDGRLETLLTAPYTIAGDALLPLYGVARPAGADALAPLPLDPSQRAGILTQPAFLALHAHPNQSAPVQRGKLIRQNILCEPVPDPPPGVNTTPPSPAANATTRQRFAVHESVPSCAGCHSLIDGIGFGLENFDGIGQFRSLDADQPVDASGAFVGTRDLDGTFQGAVELSHQLAGSPEVHACVASQWLSYALGRMQTQDDGCSLRRLVASFEASGQDIRQLLVEIVTADSFRYRRASIGGNP
jgi:hypothetical protein